MSNPLENSVVITSSPVQVTETPKLDLESYISNYDGQTRLDRLICIATSSQLPISRDALRLALADTKAGKDVERYLALTKYAADTGQTVETDLDWVTRTRELVARETQKLEHELKGYKNNLIKESIRMGNEDLGHHYYSIGDYASAYKAYTRMREFCTTPKHLGDMSLHLILVAAAQENWMTVQSSIYKVQALLLKEDDRKRIEPIIDPIAGLAALASGNYDSAADRFLESDPAFLALDAAPRTSSSTGSGLGINFQRQLLTPNDVAVYGALCALGTLDRAALKRRVLENPNFRTFLELEPHLRRAIACLVDGKYTQALEILEGYRADYLFDMFLQKHVEELYATIRRKAICAFVAPFARLSLASMTAAFGVKPRARTLTNGAGQSAIMNNNVAQQELEQELVTLISGGQLPGFRIDAVNSELVTVAEDKRRLAHENALKVADETERALRLRLFRVNMVQAGFEVLPGKQGSLKDSKPSRVRAGGEA